jgi:GTP cyclohydrolase I
MPQSEGKSLPDIQSSTEDRGVSLDNVGVTNLVYPINIRIRPADGVEETVNVISTVGKFEASVRLPKVQRGTHMSRLVSVIEKNRSSRMNLLNLQKLAIQLCEILEADASRISVNFDYFSPKAAPASNEVGLMNYACSFEAINNVITVVESDDGRPANQVASWLTVTVPVMSLCPCSKEISDYGAHNQRCHVKTRIRLRNPTKFLWIEEVVELVEQCASSPVYPILKRPDERHVTMISYDNPMFVEDITREVVRKLDEDSRILEYSVLVKSRESIHNHDAYAQKSYRKER